MRWPSRTTPDLVSSEDIAQFGRFQLLGAELSGVADASAVLALLEPLRVGLYDDPSVERRVHAELRRHATRGEWETVGAWRFVYDFVADAELDAEMRDAGLLALGRMRITNLAIHVPLGCIDRYRELTGQAPPDDGFFGPPVFDSPFGPTRQFYFDRAIAASAARAPTRLHSAPGVEPGPLDDAATALWDFGMLVLRGPLLVAPDRRFEPSTVRAAVVAATDVDHRLLAEGFRARFTQPAAGDFNAWECMGAGRFLEDFLDAQLTGSEPHAALVDEGLRQLSERGMLGLAMPLETLSSFERTRL